jgi:hypothetical protein
MNIADQPSRTGHIENKALAYLICRRIILPNVEKVSPIGLVCRPPPVVKPIGALWVALLCLFNRRPSDDVHGSPQNRKHS